MIRRHTLSEPFLLRPAGKDYIWGGTRLRDDFHKETECDPLAETWECSVHSDGESFAASGRFKGKPLSYILSKRPDYLGTHCSGELPIIVKLIDAKEDLSVQVHPDDEYAAEKEGGQGKTEMWYILDSAPGAKLVYGFSRDMERNELESALAEGTVEKYLQKVDIKKDDVFYIPAGTVHAIGAGALIAEIQQNSNLTYRLFDYDRTDRNGKKRDLHIDKALDTVDLRKAGMPRQPIRVKRFKRGYATETLCRCRYFNVERMLLNTENTRSMASFRTDETSFRVMLCAEGCGVISYDGGSLNFFRGDCIFVPAGSKELKIHGIAQMIITGC